MVCCRCASSSCASFLFRGRTCGVSSSWEKGGEWLVKEPRRMMEKNQHTRYHLTPHIPRSPFPLPFTWLMTRLRY